MRRGMLIVDRGSREREVRDELDEICARAMEGGGYDYAAYCFLEVLPPFMPEGMSRALAENLDTLTVVPYFLYPGKKLKAAVRDAMREQSTTTTRIIVTRPMRMHSTLVRLVESRVRDALDGEGLSGTADADVDVLVIGHGSVDPSARMSLDYLVERLRPRYRNASYCLLEIEQPDIASGVERCAREGPGVLAVVFYFLHEGAHVKRDVYADLNPALEAASGIGKAVVTRHLGTDPMMVSLILERAAEAETGAD